MCIVSYSTGFDSSSVIFKVYENPVEFKSIARPKIRTRALGTTDLFNEGAYTTTLPGPCEL